MRFFLDKSQQAEACTPTSRNMQRPLILVPTEYELAHLRPRLMQVMESVGGSIAVCGFGPIASGILTTQLLAHHKPVSVILLGIAGAFNPKAMTGTADIYSSIGCYGIGAGSGSDFKTANELGWDQWTDVVSGESCRDTILCGRGCHSINSNEPMLLTVCSASASPTDVAQRLGKFPYAVAEDMEAFSVALACRMARIPLTVIRGISNIAGDRDKANWNVAAALDAAAELAASRIST